MIDLRDIAWMRVQWKRFRRMLGGATGMIWLLCSSGVIFIGGEEEHQWFYARMALLCMLIASTVVSIWLFVAARRELKELDRVAVEMQAEEAQTAKKKPRKRS